MFTLTYHLDELQLETCIQLAAQLEALAADEWSYRGLLIKSGVQSTFKHAALPAEGRMAPTIDEAQAAYDDQRVCSSCQHTCMLSAVCCSCSEHKVSCLKCTDQLCGCPRTSKFILEVSRSGGGVWVVGRAGWWGFGRWVW